jgi:hypothetical protein
MESGSSMPFVLDGSIEIIKIDQLTARLQMQGSSLSSILRSEDANAKILEVALWSCCE